MSDPDKSLKFEMPSKLIVVSNRLPITLSRSEESGWSFSMSSGGLVSALSGLKKDTVFTWLGNLNGFKDQDGQDRRFQRASKGLYRSS